MKRQCHFKERILDVDNLYLAYCKARRGKQQKKEVRAFASHLDQNIMAIRDSLESGSVSLGNYRYFTIHDPKERLICAAPFQERVIHHAIMNVCHDTFDRTLIDTTYATRKGKGVYAALDKVKWGMARYEYTVKLDVRKYYDSICHSVLRARLRRLFKGPITCIFPAGANAASGRRCCSTNTSTTVEDGTSRICPCTCCRLWPLRSMQTAANSVTVYSALDINNSRCPSDGWK